MNDDSRGKYALVNSFEMYYEVHGTGEPLILLHGGVGAIEMFGEVLELLAQDCDWSDEVAAIEAPTMIVVGDADSVRPAHAVRFFELLGSGGADAGWDGSGMSNARLAVLPATTHYEIFSSPTLASAVTPFLDSPMPETR